MKSKATTNTPQTEPAIPPRTLHRPDGELVFAPVRHHSPACARAVRAVAMALRPAAILIEGPADFNDRINDLWLPHELPIALYSYVRHPDGWRRGAFYPFCEHSPEWQALQSARERNVPARFIDLPWRDVASPTTNSHRYADTELRTSPFLPTLCARAGVDDFDALWDRLVEVDPSTLPDRVLDSAHRLCAYLRQTSEFIDDEDIRREHAMAVNIEQALAAFGGPLLIVTGGFHTTALIEHLRVADADADIVPQTVTIPSITTNQPTSTQQNDADAAPEDASNVAQPVDVTTEGATSAPHPADTIPGTDAVLLAAQPTDTDAAAKDGTPAQPAEAAANGIDWAGDMTALTPYSDDRLDSLTGYDAGMPSPGFYYHVWRDREAGRGPSYRSLLAQAVRGLRRREQRISTADLIAVEVSAQSLAQLRGHTEVWRTDLIDAVLSALVKEAIAPDTRHPLLDALLEVLRGHKRGKLAAGTALPPLVYAIQAELAAHDLAPQQVTRDLRLELTNPAERTKSRVLHQLRTLGISGFTLVDHTDLVGRADLSSIWEQWRIAWSPAFEANCIESAIYGATLGSAAMARITERARTSERNAQHATLLLIDMCLMGLEDAANALIDQLGALIDTDPEFGNIASALDHILYLYRYDDALGVLGQPVIGALLTRCFDRAVWLLGLSGQAGQNDADLINGLRTVLHTYQATGRALALNGDALTTVLRHTAEAPGQRPLLRGAATGMLWTLGAVADDALTIDAYSKPLELGDYLTGLFALAREAVQRYPALLERIDALVMTFDDAAYLQALPALRLAFSFFTPREKHNIAHILAGEDISAQIQLITPIADPETTARALAAESRLMELLQRYGIRRS